jgi:hypothetical protein
MYCCFHTFVINMPDDGSDKPKQATHWFITLKCCVCILRWYFNIAQHESMNQNKKITHKTNYRDQAAKQQHEQGVWVPGRSIHEGQAADSPLHNKIITFSCCDTCRLLQHSHRVVYGYHVLQSDRQVPATQHTLYIGTIPHSLKPINLATQNHNQDDHNLNQHHILH